MTEPSPEQLLGFLANDKDPDIRALVAQGDDNKISENFYDESNEEVRRILGIKISKALPELSKQKNSKLRDLTHQILEGLVMDHAISVRRAVSETLKDVDCTPESLAFKLAADTEKEVAIPILRYSKALTNDDILTLIKQYPQAWRLVELAKREDLSNDSVDALLKTDNPDVVGLILDNHGNVISEDDLESVTTLAEEKKKLQTPLAHRPELPMHLGIKIANFAEEAVLKILSSRKDFDRQTLSEISEISSRRLGFRNEFEKQKNPKSYALILFQKNELTEDALKDGLSWGEITFCIEAIALKTNLNPLLVKKVIHSFSAKSITAIIWLAGLSMRFSLLIQQKIAQLPSSKILYARNGIDFPLSEEEMAWQLEFFGIQIENKNKEKAL